MYTEFYAQDLSLWWFSVATLKNVLKNSILSYQNLHPLIVFAVLLQQKVIKMRVKTNISQSSFT